MHNYSRVSIEIEHKLLNKASLFVNDQLISTITNQTICTWERKLPSVPQQICIAFEPWGIDPIIRIDNFLIHKWVGQILLLDHQLLFWLSNTFFDDYRAKDLQGRIDSLGSSPTSIAVDRAVGRNYHEHIVKEIREKIAKNSHIS